MQAGRVAAWRKSLNICRRLSCGWLGQLVLLAAILLYSGPGASEVHFETGFGLRNHNPFLQIYGLPTFKSAWLSTTDKPTFDVYLDLANHADSGENPFERVVIDGESYFLTFAYRARATDWLELGVELPLVAHGDGFMDNGIEGWHDLFGLSNNKRTGPGNVLQFFYERNGQTLVDLSAPASGLGDIQLIAAMPLPRSGALEPFRASLRASLKLPTGDEDQLRGSGAADFALGIHASDEFRVRQHDVAVSAFAGALFLGDRDVLTVPQRETVPYGGVAATWQATGRLGITSQLYAQGRYLESELDELGGNSYQLAVGGNYRLGSRNALLRFALVEDVSDNATTDFALHFSVQWHGGL